MEQNDMAKRIRELRTQNNMTLEDVANGVGVGKSTVRKWETGIIANMRRDKIAALAQTLHTTPAYLMGWEDNSITPKHIELEPNMTKGEKIKEIRISLGMSQTNFADKIGVSKQTLYKYENDIITNIPSDKIENIAKLGNILPSYLMGWEDTPTTIHTELKPATKRRYKYLGEIACGEPIFANEEYETYMDLDTDIQADFVLKAKGDSMVNARIFDGDIVFIRQQPDVNDGEIAAVIIDDEATLKRVYKYENHISLNAENPIYKPIQVRYDDAKNVKIIGRAIAATIQLK